jgi:hypothetical protein
VITLATGGALLVGGAITFLWSRRMEGSIAERTVLVPRPTRGGIGLSLEGAF